MLPNRRSNLGVRLQKFTGAHRVIHYSARLVLLNLVCHGALKLDISTLFTTFFL